MRACAEAGLVTPEAIAGAPPGVLEAALLPLVSFSREAVDARGAARADAGAAAAIAGKARAAAAARVRMRARLAEAAGGSGDTPGAMTPGGTGVRPISQ